MVTTVESVGSSGPTEKSRKNGGETLLRLQSVSKVFYTDEV